MNFEQFIKRSDDYTNLRFQYGNQLFVQEQGGYKIQAVRLAHEVWEYKQHTCIEHGEVAFCNGCLREANQHEIEALKVKNAKLVHATIDANERASHWAKSYWECVERSAEYQAMLMNSPDEMAVECFKREKQIEKLKAENNLLKEALDIKDKLNDALRAKALENEAYKLNRLG